MSDVRGASARDGEAVARGPGSARCRVSFAVASAVALRRHDVGPRGDGRNIRVARSNAGAWHTDPLTKNSMCC